MNQKQTPQERARELAGLLVSDWQPTARQLLWAIRITLILFIVILVGYAYEITLWHWLQLLLLPVTVAVGGAVGAAWFAKQRAKDEALLKYLDQMGQLLNTGLRESSQDSDVRKLARAWTQTTLEMLDDPGRKRSLLRFLYESQLICKDRAVISLKRARLQGVDLEDARLVDADLRGAWLCGANLRRANLTGADLSDADLTNAMGITAEKLEQQAASLEGATMPNGQKYEEWLKYKEGRGKDGENGEAS